jgi:DNA-binding MarR family transcriptional regulator
MALRRIYTFEEEAGLNLKRMTPTDAGAEDELLEPVGLSNWQLATLYVIELEESATAPEIGFALVMDRPTVAAIIRPLEKRKAIKKIPPRGGRRDAMVLTEAGRELLGKGLELWRTAKTASRAPENSKNKSVVGTSAASDERNKNFA